MENIIYFILKKCLINFRWITIVQHTNIFFILLVLCGLLPSFKWEKMRVVIINDGNKFIFEEIFNDLKLYKKRNIRIINYENITAHII